MSILFIQFALPAWLIWSLVGGLAAAIVIALFKKKLNGKKLCLVGPSLAGKTTFLNWIKSDKFIPIDPGSRTPKNYVEKGKIENINYIITDTVGNIEAGGGPIFVKAIQKNYNIVFFFELQKYFIDEKYREEEVFPRLSELAKEITPREGIKLVFVGSHRDELGNMSEHEIMQKLFSPLDGKPYEFLFNDYDVIPCDFHKREDYIKILYSITK